ncbi:MAG: hypothetical protein LBT64_03125 [Puniceicoccales bacterium]|jgi:hypothetical protein|nr:hypothetical protein [Puniceicoccales bacterium]
MTSSLRSSSSSVPIKSTVTGQPSNAAKFSKPGLIKPNDGDDIEKNPDLKAAIDRAKIRGDLPKEFKGCDMSHRWPSSKDYAVIRIGDMCMLAKLNTKTGNFDADMSTVEVNRLNISDSTGNPLGEVLTNALNYRPSGKCTDESCALIKGIDSMRTHFKTKKKHLTISVDERGNITATLARADKKNEAITIPLTYNSSSGGFRANYYTCANLEDEILTKILEDGKERKEEEEKSKDASSSSDKEKTSPSSVTDKKKNNEKEMESMSSSRRDINRKKHQDDNSKNQTSISSCELTRESSSSRKEDDDGRSLSLDTESFYSSKEDDDDSVSVRAIATKKRIDMKKDDDYFNRKKRNKEKDKEKEEPKQRVNTRPYNYCEILYDSDSPRPRSPSLSSTASSSSSQTDSLNFFPSGSHTPLFSQGSFFSQGPLVADDQNSSKNSETISMSSNISDGSDGSDGPSFSYGGSYLSPKTQKNNRDDDDNSSISSSSSRSSRSSIGSETSENSVTSDIDSRRLDSDSDE